MNIRPVNEDDQEDLEKVRKQAWIEGHKDLLTEDEIQLAKEYSKYLKPESLRDKKNSDKVFFLVAEAKGRIVGQIILAWNNENTGEFINPEQNEAQLRGMYIHPDYWRQNIGTELVKTAIQKLPNYIDSVNVEVFEQNTRGIKFYESLGFKEDSERTLDQSMPLVNTDHQTLVLKKDLAE